jgi:hypothetical protein
MKKVILQKTKNYSHVIGEEIEREYVFDPQNKKIGFFIDYVTNDIDGETWDNHQDELDNVYNNENGEYFIDNNDFTIYIRIEDYLGE